MKEIREHAGGSHGTTAVCCNSTARELADAGAVLSARRWKGREPGAGGGCKTSGLRIRGEMSKVCVCV